MALCLEQTLGHRAHCLNLEAAARERASVRSLRVNFPAHRRLPVPWAARGSLGAWRQVVRGRFAATLFHTPTIALLAPMATRRRPYILSLDATPAQVDAMGEWYAHRRGSAFVEAAKRKAYAAVFRRASGVVSWSRWALASLERDYGYQAIDPLVAHPGAPAGFFAIDRAARRPGPVRVLFVGGDFRRKGGDVLLEAASLLGGRVEVTLVTEAAIQPCDGVRVLSGITPGTDALRAAYADADIFCLPTRGDCTPIVLGEAMAAGLPVVTTSVGSNAETVRDGVTGLLVPVGDARATETALAGLVDDEALRLRFGRAARAIARDEMDAAVNANRILDYLAKVA
ncbi:MAG: glycosyltransferase family 4 protein [Dehalococcoidia bacterium]